MERNNAAYLNFVCPYCWNTLDKCVCKTFPPYHLIFIDRGIQEHVRILNNKGYRTIGCCEGHMKDCVNTYIVFAQECFAEDVILPDGFVYDKKKRLLRHEYKVRCLTPETFEKEKSKHVEKLLLWCKSLPEIK